MFQKEGNKEYKELVTMWKERINLAHLRKFSSLEIDRTRTLISLNFSAVATEAIRAIARRYIMIVV